MPPSEFQRALVDAYRAIYSPRQALRALKRGEFANAKWKLVHRYLWRAIEPGLLEYASFLREIEDGLYVDDGRLREDALVHRVQQDPRWTFQAGNRALETLGLSPLELPIPGERNITCVPPRLASTH
jgi:hypothetical protein